MVSDGLGFDRSRKAFLRRVAFQSSVETAYAVTHVVSSPVMLATLAVKLTVSSHFKPDGNYDLLRITVHMLLTTSSSISTRAVPEGVVVVSIILADNHYWVFAPHKMCSR